MAVKAKATQRSSFLDKVLGRLDRLNNEGLQAVIQRLARERAFLETVFNSIEDGVVVLDTSGRIVYFNATATKLIGLSQSDSEGEIITRYLPNLDWARLASPGSEGRPGVFREEFEIQYPRPRYLRIYSTPLDGGDSGSAGLALILHDATEARIRTNEAVESERVHALTLLAATVAHEIGNPLNALHIHLQLIERELAKLRRLSPPSPPPAPSRRTGTRKATDAPEPPADNLSEDSFRKTADYLKVAKGEIDRLDYILTDFLQAVRQTPPKFVSGDLNTVVEATLAVLAPELQNRQLVVVKELTRSLPEARFDPVQIKQVLLNLLKNAMQAMRAGGILTLTTGTGADGVWVSVSDTGNGIPQETLNRIFEPFYTTKRKGTGLGLMIVQRILRAHGGKIELNSEPGKGTTFRFWLPLATPAPRLLPG